MIRDISNTLIRLQDESTPLSDTLLETLSDLDRSSQNAFRTVWSQLSADRRKQLITALTTLAEENVNVDFKFILRLSLDDPDEEVRAQALRGLWEDESPTLTGPLLRLLTGDPAERVRAGAAKALGQFILMGEMGQLDMSRAFAVQEALLRAYNNPKETVEVRRHALESLAFSSDEAIRDIIEAAYRNGDDRMIVSAIFAMGRSADPHWQRTILNELSSSNAESRFEAARAAGELEIAEAVHPLDEIAHLDSDEQVREMAVHALGQIGGNEARRVLESLEETEDNEELQEAVAEALDELAFLEDALDAPPLFGFGDGTWAEGTDEQDGDDGDDDDNDDDDYDDDGNADEY
jgi:HEAT repeat protein